MGEWGVINKDCATLREIPRFAPNEVHFNCLIKGNFIFDVCPQGAEALGMTGFGRLLAAPSFRAKRGCYYLFNDSVGDLSTGCSSGIFLKKDKEV